MPPVTITMITAMIEVATMMSIRVKPWSPGSGRACWSLM